MGEGGPNVAVAAEEAEGDKGDEGSQSEPASEVGGVLAGLVEETAVNQTQAHHAQPGQNGIQHQCLPHEDVAKAGNVEQQSGGGEGGVVGGGSGQQGFGGEDEKKAEGKNGRVGQQHYQRSNHHGSTQSIQYTKIVKGAAF